MLKLSTTSALSLKKKKSLPIDPVLMKGKEQCLQMCLRYNPFWSGRDGLKREGLNDAGVSVLKSGVFIYH